MENEATPAPAADDSAQPAPEAAPEASEQPKSLSDTIDAAFEEVGYPPGPDDLSKPEPVKNVAEPAAPDVEPEQEAEAEEAGPERDEQGRFVAKDDTEQSEPEPKQEAAPEPEAEPDPELINFVQPPSRFSPDAKEAWAKAPEAIRAEITRAVEELEGGIEQYQTDFAPYKDFDQQIKANGQTFQEVLGHYTGIEQQLAANPLSGLDTICRNLGTTLHDVAQQVVAKTPEQVQQDGVIGELRQQVTALQGQLNNVATSQTEQTDQQLQMQINSFATDKPRFEELRADMGFLMENGRANTMQEAYDLAAEGRFKPAQDPQPAPAAAPAAPAADPAAQTREKGKLSVSGAPSSGSNPTNRKPPSSVRDAVDNAFTDLGI